MGILEDILKEQQEIKAIVLAIQTSLNGAPVTEAPVAVVAAPVIETPLVIQETPPLTESDLDRNSCPWDARINTNNRNLTAKGVYKRKPGIETQFYLDILEEIRCTNNAKLEAGEAVPVESLEVDDKRPCLEAINDITNEYGIDADGITEMLGCDFPGVSPDQYENIIVKCKGWGDYLKLIRQSMNNVTELKGDPLEVLKQFGADKLGLVHYGDVEKCYDAMTQLEQSLKSTPAVTAPPPAAVTPPPVVTAPPPTRDPVKMNPGLDYAEHIKMGWDDNTLVIHGHAVPWPTGV